MVGMRLIAKVGVSKGRKRLSKATLINAILLELRKAQTEIWKPPTPGKVKQLRLPPMLPTGDGTQLRTTEALQQLVSEYSDLLWENSSALKAEFTKDELEKLSRNAFGRALASAELEQPDEELQPQIKALVEQQLTSNIEFGRQARALTVGCHLFEGDEAYPIRVGPVVFQTRKQWTSMSLKEGKISKITARRLESSWQGKRVRQRKSASDWTVERSMLDAVGDCPVVCTIETFGLSSEYIRTKGLVAARIAMTAISLMWTHPSEGLIWMNLLYDRRIFRRQTAVFNSTGFSGSYSGISQMPSGRWTDDELIRDLQSRQWLLDVTGEALKNYIQPNLLVKRPSVMNALFLSLLWFHEACREPLDQIATTKFAASLDALANGTKAKGIIRLIETRLGFKPDDQLMTDGRTTKVVIGQIYDAGRSRLIHGSSDDFAHDWKQTRQSAEVIGRLCLVEICHLLSKNKTLDDPKQLSCNV